MARTDRKQRNWPLIVAFSVALGATLFFAVRMTVSAFYWADPAHQDQPVAAWMTPRYVAHSRKIPPELVSDALQIDRDDPPRRKSLSELAEERDVPVQSLIDTLEATIAAYKAGQ